MSVGTSQVDVIPGAAAPVVNMAIDPSPRQNPAEWVRWGFGGLPSDSGVTVDARSALTHSPVWQAINILSGDVAQLEFLVNRYRGERKEHASNHRVDWTIGVSPNRYQTTDTYYEHMMGTALGWGNAISAIDTSEGDIELIPLPPESTRHEEISRGDYLITTRIDNVEKAYLPEETVHLRGLTRNGFWGLSAVKTCKNRLGHGMALLKHGNNTFKNGARPSGVLKFPQGVSIPIEARAQLRREWEQMHQGPANAGRTAVLWDGGEWQQNAMSNEDAQWAESTELDLLFVAGVFLIPPYKLGYMKDSSVRSNLEAQQREYYHTSLARWVCRFRKEFETKLFSLRERRSRRYRVGVNIDNLTQGTRKERMETVALGVRTRLLTRNEGRDELSYNPVEGGDEFENPAIDTAADIETTEDAGKQIENALRKRGIEPLLAAEAGRLKHAASNVSNFIEWLDKFCEGYEAFAESFVAPLAELGGNDWRMPVCQHAEKLKGDILRLTDSAQPENLAAMIAEYAKPSIERADELTKTILET